MEDRSREYTELSKNICAKMVKTFADEIRKHDENLDDRVVGLLLVGCFTQGLQAALAGHAELLSKSEVNEFSRSYTKMAIPLILSAFGEVTVTACKGKEDVIKKLVADVATDKTMGKINDIATGGTDERETT